LFFDVIQLLFVEHHPWHLEARLFGEHKRIVN